MTFKNGVAKRTLVKTGYAGTLITKVKSGLTAGQQVILADLNTALPTNSTSSTRRLGVGGGTSRGLGGAGPGGGEAAGGGGSTSHG